MNQFIFFIAQVPHKDLNGSVQHHEKVEICTFIADACETWQIVLNFIGSVSFNNGFIIEYVNGTRAKFSDIIYFFYVAHIVVIQLIQESGQDDDPSN